MRFDLVSTRHLRFSGILSLFIIIIRIAYVVNVLRAVYVPMGSILLLSHYLIFTGVHLLNFYAVNTHHIISS